MVLPETSLSPLLDDLMTALRVLPGVGPKSAQRMAMHLLERNREGGRVLGCLLSDAMERIDRCRQISQVDLGPPREAAVREHLLHRSAELSICPKDDGHAG